MSEGSDPALREARRTAVLGSVPSDSHHWNLIFLQLLLEEQGFTVTNLGPCTPVTDVVQRCLRLRPDLTVISSVNGHARTEGVALAHALRALPGRRDAALVIGGMLTTAQADSGAAARELLLAGFDAVFIGPDAVDRFLGFLSPSSALTPSGNPTPWARRSGVLAGAR